MNKFITLGAAVIAALAATTAGIASAEGSKHYGYGHVNGYRPAYVAPGPVRGYYAPNRGHWHGGRWIAPVVVGGLVAAAVGSAYTYNNYGYNNYGYNYPAPVHVAPSYYAPAAVSYAAPPRTGFDYADANGDGYVSFEEAAVYPHWQRNFGNMDRNRDGYLARNEVAGWRYR